MRKGREGREDWTLLGLDPDSRPGQRTKEGTAGRQMTQATNPFVSAYLCTSPGNLW